jgi:hypothetical protein
MSDHGHAASTEGHGDHHEEYLGIPADEPGPGEPSTPGWLTLLGMGLVLSAMLAFLATRPDGKTRAELTPGASASASAAAAPAAPTPAPSPARPALDAIRPAGSATAAAIVRPGASGTPRLLKPGQFAVNPGGTVAPARRRPPEHAP